MFLKNNFEKELCEAMEISLIEKQASHNSSIIKIAKAADLISKAHNIFNKAGFTSESNELKKFLFEVANKYSK